MTRSLQAITASSICEDASALRDPAVTTLAQIRDHEHASCPLFTRCSAGTLLGPDLRNCAPRMGHAVAKHVAAGSTLDKEMHDIEGAPVFSRLGFIDPYKDPGPEARVKEKVVILPMIREWAETILNGSSGFGPGARDERCICPVLRPTLGGCPVHGG